MAYEIRLLRKIGTKNPNTWTEDEKENVDDLFDYIGENEIEKFEMTKHLADEAPIYVLVIDVIIYVLLSALILYKRHKKIKNNQSVQDEDDFI